MLAHFYHSEIMQFPCTINQGALKAPPANNPSRKTRTRASDKCKLPIPFPDHVADLGFYWTCSGADDACHHGFTSIVDALLSPVLFFLIKLEIESWPRRFGRTHGKACFPPQFILMLANFFCFYQRFSNCLRSFEKSCELNCKTASFTRFFLKQYLINFKKIIKRRYEIHRAYLVNLKNLTHHKHFL